MKFTMQGYVNRKSRTPKELAPRLWNTTMMIAGLREVARASVKVDHFMQVQIVKEVVKLFETVVV